MLSTERQHEIELAYIKSGAHLKFLPKSFKKLETGGVADVAEAQKETVRRKLPQFRKYRHA